jgi:DNA polymerase-3 subunit delta
MDYIKIISELKSGRIRPVYLLYGEETYLTRQIEKILVEMVLNPDERETCLTVLENDPSPAYLAGLIETAPFFGGRNVIIIRETSLFKPRKGAAESADNNQDKDGSKDQLISMMQNIPDYSLVIFTTAGKTDKRRKLYKVIEQQGAVVELSPPKAKEARMWVTEKLEALSKKMAPDAMEYFLGILSMTPKISIGMIHHELDKIAVYVGVNRTITLRDLTDIMASLPEVNIFEMTEALSRKDIKIALQLLRTQLSAGEPPIKIVGLLAFHVRRIWQVKELANTGKGSKDIGDALTIHSFIAERMLRQSRNFSVKQLKEAILQLAAADRALKNGRASSSLLEKIIIELCV